MSDKSSKEEDRRYRDLEVMQMGGLIADLKRHPVLVAPLNDLIEIEYTDDASYSDLESGEVVYWDWKGFIHVKTKKGKRMSFSYTNHESILRIRIMSAFFPLAVFKMYNEKGLWKVYKAGKAVRVKKVKR